MATRVEVDREPTEEMLFAANKAWGESTLTGDLDIIRVIWDAMVEASEKK